MRDELIKKLSMARSKEEAKTLVDSYNNETELSDEELEMVSGGFEPLVPGLECDICHMISDDVQVYKWLSNTKLCYSCVVKHIIGIK